MLQAAIDDLQAETIAVPPFEVDYLLRGHAVHFRCRDQDAERMRLDVMARMRGVAPFEELWARRTTMELEAGGKVEVMSLPDLIAAKKTQRDKDWPMIRRLVEAHFALNQNKHTADRIRFWLAESRTPETLIQIASQHGQLADEITLGRPLIKHAKLADLPALEHGLEEEEQHEREADRAYWAPLKAELEQLRHSGR
jgi:hypothetical protein